MIRIIIAAGLLLVFAIVTWPAMAQSSFCGGANCPDYTKPEKNSENRVPYQSYGGARARGSDYDQPKTWTETRSMCDVGNGCPKLFICTKDGCKASK